MKNKIKSTAILFALLVFNHNTKAQCNIIATAAQDIINCGSPSQFYLASTGSGTFTNIQWSPVTYLTNTNSSMATLTMQGNNTIDMNYVVTYSDSITGCSDSDTIHVFAAQGIQDSVLMCNNAASVLFANYGAQSYNWNPTGFTQPYLTITSPGTYLCVESYTNGCALTQIYYVIDTCSTNPCNFSISAGSNVNLCATPPGTTGTLNGAITPSGNYSIQWSPANGLSSTSIINPIVSNIYNQGYLLTVSDIATGCTLTDSVHATVLNASYGNIYNCNGSPVTIYNVPGAYYYQWLSGFSTSTPSNQNSTIITVPGAYVYAALYQGCAVTNSITLVDSCNALLPNVWPGDCNYDLIANYLDFLNICMAYGTTGATRPAANLSWTAQPMLDWGTNSYYTDDKHADCDGNGIINVNDATAIIQNYNLSHVFRQAATQPNSIGVPLYLVANTDTAGLGETIVFDIILGDSIIPASLIYALAYQLTYDSLFIGTMGSVNYNNSWFGNPSTDQICMEKQLPNNAQIDCSVGGNNLINRSGQGKIGQISLVVTADNLSGMFHMNLQNVFAIGTSQLTIALNAWGDSVYIDQTIQVAMSETTNLNNLVQMYPNPSKDEVNIKTELVKLKSANVFDMLGNRVICEKQTQNKNLIRISNLSRGMYNVRIETEQGIINKKLVIQ